MDKKKWNEIVDEELKPMNGTPVDNPENWHENRKVILNFVKAIDEATEVYFLENDKSQK